MGRKLDDKLRSGGSAHSMGDKQSQGQQAKNAVSDNSVNGGMEQTLEFRPNNSGSNGHQPSVVTASSTNGSQSARSKSPGGQLINKISNFARGKYRNSLSEKQANSVASDEKIRKVCIIRWDSFLKITN